MSLIDNFKGKAAKSGNAPTVSQIQAQLDDAQAQRGGHDEIMRVLSLEVVSGVSGAEERLATVKAAAAKTQEQTMLLANALQAARAAEEAKVAQQRKDIAKSARRAMEKAIQQRDAAATEAVALAAKLAKAYRALHAASAEAVRCCPPGFTFPPGTNFQEGEITKLMQRQLWKASAKPSNNDRLAIPAAAPGDLRFVDDPTRPEDLDVVIRRDSEFCLANLQPGD